MPPVFSLASLTLQSRQSVPPIGGRPGNESALLRVRGQVGTPGSGARMPRAPLHHNQTCQQAKAAERGACHHQAGRDGEKVHGGRSGHCCAVPMSGGVGTGHSRSPEWGRPVVARRRQREIDGDERKNAGQAKGGPGRYYASSGDPTGVGFANLPRPLCADVCPIRRRQATVWPWSAHCPSGRPCKNGLRKRAKIPLKGDGAVGGVAAVNPSPISSVTPRRRWRDPCATLEIARGERLRRVTAALAGLRPPAVLT